MKKRVLDIGNCDPDHAALRRLIEGNFDAELHRAHGWDDAEPLLRGQTYDLVMVNRKLDRDYSDGLNVIVQLKAVPHLANLPVMLITNYAESQDQAVAAGAERGFGKLALDDPQTLANLARHLGTDV